jgi:hypothetical protein
MLFEPFSTFSAVLNRSESFSVFSCVVCCSLFSAVTEDDAMATFGIAPRDSSRFVADHVTGAALETLLVVEQDAAVVGGYEQLRWTSPNACLSGAAFANLRVDGDVRGMRNAKVDGFHTIIEAQRCLGSLGKKRRNRHVTNLEPKTGYVELAVGHAIKFEVRFEVPV